MATRLLFTIDTELTWRHHGPDGWERNHALSVEPAGVGLAYQLETLAKYGLKACFFVDPMPALVYGPEPIRRMVEPILAAGQEVQLHLHSFWHDLAAGRADARFELTAFDGESQERLVATARDLLVAAGAPPPIAFRAGSFAADLATLKAVRAAGLAFDASHNGADHPQVSALPIAADTIDPTPCEGLVLVPVTQILQPKGSLRPFQICALSRREMEAALRHAAAQGHPLVTIVGHSFELATRDGRRENRLVRNRFDRLCAFLADHRAEMETIAFAEVPAPDPSRRSRPLDASLARQAQRLAEQGWGNARYEQPVRSAAIAAAPSLAALGLVANVLF